jgi:hypothetical protein
MAKEKKTSKGPKDRNSNYQMKNGNSVSKKHNKMYDAKGSEETKSSSMMKSGGPKSFISSISSGISSATNGISKIFKRNQ